ncbi:MAG TPA: hypothetical protein VK025_07155 [Steroidobacter sp.]|nr:hypothetical protein [Steroidobacter sp.]
MKQFPRDLKSDEGLARASCERQQDPIATVRDRFEHTHDCGVLIVAPLEEAALVLKRHSGEPIAPCVRFREREIPQLVRRREARLLTLASRLHIDAIHTTTVRREGMTDRELGRVILGLLHSERQRLIPRFGFNDGQTGVAIDEQVIGGERLRSPPMPLQSPKGDRVLAPYAAAFNHAPACRFQCRVDVISAGFGLVHVPHS